MNFPNAILSSCRLARLSLKTWPLKTSDTILAPWVLVISVFISISNIEHRWFHIITVLRKWIDHFLLGLFLLPFIRYLLLTAMAAQRVKEAPLLLYVANKHLSLSFWMAFVYVSNFFIITAYYKLCTYNVGLLLHWKLITSFPLPTVYGLIYHLQRDKASSETFGLTDFQLVLLIFFFLSLLWMLQLTLKFLFFSFSFLTLPQIRCLSTHFRCYRIRFSFLT